jgi:hypothetical protein
MPRPTVSIDASIIPEADPRLKVSTIIIPTLITRNITAIIELGNPKSKEKNVGTDRGFPIPLEPINMPITMNNEQIAPRIMNQGSFSMFWYSCGRSVRRAISRTHSAKNMTHPIKMSFFASANFSSGFIWL